MSTYNRTSDILEPTKSGGGGVGSQSGVFDNFFWIMAGFGGVGAFIDFLLGKPGQKKVRSLIETWWLQFNEVKWRSFGRAEAELVIGFLDRRFGRRLWSQQRWWTSLVLVVVATLVGVAAATVAQLLGDDVPLLSADVISSTPIWIATTALSISVTRILSRAVALASVSRITTAAAFSALLVLHLLIALMWAPVVTVLQSTISMHFMNPGRLSPWPTSVAVGGSDDVVVIGFHFREPQRAFPIFRAVYLVFPTSISGAYQVAANRFKHHQYVGRRIGADPAFQASSAFLDLGLNVTRLLFALLFILSFATRPLVHRPISLLTARVVESDKPIATLVLGGFATGAKLIQEIIKRFH